MEYAKILSSKAIHRPTYVLIGTVKFFSDSWKKLVENWILSNLNLKQRVSTRFFANIIRKTGNLWTNLLKYTSLNSYFWIWSVLLIRVWKKLYSSPSQYLEHRQKSSTPPLWRSTTWINFLICFVILEFFCLNHE